MRKRVNKIISVALSATLAFGVFTALPMSANAVVSTASEVSAEAIPKHELYKSYTYGGYKYRIVGQKSNGLWVRNQTEDLTHGLNLIPVSLQASMFLRQSVIVIWSALTTIVFRLTKL